MTVPIGLPVHAVDIEHVYHSDGEDVTALSGVDLHIEPGESLAILGPSGSGKSTLMTLLAGLRRPSSGQLYIGRQDVAQLSERELLILRRNDLSVVVQNPGRNLLPYGTAEDNITFAQRATPRYRRARLPVPLELMAMLDMQELAHKRVARMSGGEQQRLAVAVGMSIGPGLLLADEPTSQLDTPNRDRVVRLLRRITSEFGTTVVAVTHDADVAAAAGRTVLIEDGRLSEPGRTDRPERRPADDPTSGRRPPDDAASWRRPPDDPTSRRRPPDDPTSGRRP